MSDDSYLSTLSGYPHDSLLLNLIPRAHLTAPGSSWLTMALVDITSIEFTCPT